MYTHLENSAEKPSKKALIEMIKDVYAHNKVLHDTLQHNPNPQVKETAIKAFARMEVAQAIIDAAMGDTAILKMLGKH